MISWEHPLYNTLLVPIEESDYGTAHDTQWGTLIL